MIEEKDKQLQLDELKRAKDSAFNWSDEELLGDLDDLTNVVYKDKYQKSKKNTAAQKKGGNGKSTYLGSVKQKVKQGYSAAKAGLAPTPSNMREDTQRKGKQFITTGHDDDNELMNGPADDEEQQNLVTTSMEMRRMK